MITTESLSEPPLATASNGRYSIQVDVPVSKGGRGCGFGAHELLEASVAACMSMAVRIHAAARRIPLESVRTSVGIVSSDAASVRFESRLELRGPLSSDQRAELEALAECCPVRQTLSKRLEFTAKGE